MKKLALIASIICLAACSKQAEVDLPHVFGDGMVLQREVPVKIWGTSDAGAKIKAKWQGKTYSAVADADGKWVLELGATPAGGPYSLKINNKQLNDILVGDVYIGSGQSNMELPVKRCLDATGDYVKGYSNAKIHYLNVPQNYNFDGPQEDIAESAWQVLDSDATAMDWSAVCYFTARALQDAQPDIPIGMINASVGGSYIECWMQEGILPQKALDKLAPYKNKEYLDSIINFNNTLYSKWQNDHNALKSDPNAKWKPIEMFDTSWAKDAKGENVYGSHLLRNKINLTADQAKGEAILHLGTMADADSTFINGQYVGNTTYFYPPRNYKVPEGILKEGENEIEVHLYACGGQPASFVKDKEYALETPAGDVSLLKGWEHKAGKRMPARPSEVFLRWEPSVLWNGMLAPVKDYTCAGVIWYQGESNCDAASEYGKLLETMINDWRKEMDNPNLPFYIIELAAYQHSEETDTDYGWNRVQKEQKAVCDRMDGVYFVKNGDIGEWNDIHPQDKKTVGERVANVILNK